MALNLNIGILGHVDSGKTSLAKILSSVSSTAAFDKNPQSQARGITLDLGFSSFSVPMPDHLSNATECDTIQYTLVDCPGHASLIKTIIGGAQIIDMMLLVIDVTKGVQTQTAECIVIGEITCKKMIIVLNKIDLLEDSKRTTSIEKVSKKIKAVLKSTIFHDSSIVSVSAHPGIGDSMGINDLIEQICSYSFIPQRTKTGPFLFAIDHCFSVKGQGTVMTGTVLQGSVRVNDSIDVPSISATKKVKSMQMFHRPVQLAGQGDRLGICVTQFDPKLMERGIACTSGLATYATCAIISFKKVQYFKTSISSKMKFHVTIGYETALTVVTLFSIEKTFCKDNFNFDLQYQYVETLDQENMGENLRYYMLLEFDKPILVVKNALVIGSKLDIDIHLNVCRIGFSGRLLDYSIEKEYKDKFLPTIQIYKVKSKKGFVERVVNENTLIAKNLFKKETNLEAFINLKVELSSGEVGIIDSSFGQSGKVKILFSNGIQQSTLDKINNKAKNKRNDNIVRCEDNVVVNLHFKNFLFDVNKRMIQ